MMSTAERQLAAETWRRANGRRLLLLLDFDGTLTEFQPDPAAVSLPPLRREILAGLQRRATIGVVSGRRLDDVRRRVPLDGIVVAGLHGLEIEIPGEPGFVHPDLANAIDVIRDAGQQLRESIGGLRGVFVEDKGASFALHFREADAQDQRKAIDAFAQVTTPAVERGLARVMRGSNVLELLPNIDWNKGSAVRWIAEGISQRCGPVFLVYAGDDVTDQDALDFVDGAGGLAIAASDRVTAPIRFDGPAGVERFLSAL
jgi:trehalose-phosphatase